MKTMNPEKPFQVDVTTRERGWAPDTDILEFASREEADDYIKSVNSKNTAPTAPDIYTTATALYK